MKRLMLPVLILILFAGQAAAAPAVDQERLQQVKRDTTLFSKILGEVLKQSFDNPFALSAEPQGTYLEDYGISISFLLRINRGSIRGIYGETRYRSNTPDSNLSKQEKLKLVKRITSRTLVDYGGTIRGLKDGERISVCAHVEDRSEWDTGNRMSVIVISGTRKEIVNMSQADLSDEDLLRQLNILEY